MFFQGSNDARNVWRTKERMKIVVEMIDVVMICVRLNGVFIRKGVGKST